MNHLFIDTCSTLTLGILDENFSWIAYTQTELRQTSGSIHKEIYSMMNEYNKKWEDLGSLILASGPGSYTGMRVSEGVAQVLNWLNLPVYSFYHFEIPKFLNKENYLFMSNAFKGEFFAYKSDSQIGDSFRLYDFQAIQDLSKEYKDCYSLEILNHNDETLQGELTPHLIKDHSATILKKVFEEEIRRSVFYYRNVEDEFKVQHQ